MNQPLRAALLLVVVAAVAGVPGALAHELCATSPLDDPGSIPGDGIINTYFPGTTGAVPAGSTSIPVGTSTGAATPIATGDLLLVIQMQDADINTDNDGNYGDGQPGAPPTDDPGQGIISANNVGRYEYVVAAGPVAAGSVPIQGKGTGDGLLFSYVNEDYQAAAHVLGSDNHGPHGARSYQVIRVPRYANLTVPNGGLTAFPWGGNSVAGYSRTGGILVFDVEQELNLNGETLDVSGKGFRGGYAPRVQGEGTLTVSNSDYRNFSFVGIDDLGAHGVKGEGIAGTPRLVFDDTIGNPTPPLFDTGVEGYVLGSKARGAPGNAGGGGNTDDVTPSAGSNAGGGGGGNGGPGGRGARDGNNLSPGDPHRGGNGGAAFVDSAGAILWNAGRVVQGGGGGSGGRHNNNPDASHGNSGGGIVLIRTGSVNAAAGTIAANGLGAVDSNNDASGGGGAGGSVILVTLTGDWAGVTVTANGGNGGNAGSGSSDESPGGGGGGGVILSNAAVNAASTTDPGANGTTDSGSATRDAETGTVGTPDPGDPLNPFIDPADIPGADSGAQCAQNTGPANTVPGAQTVVKDTLLTFSAGNGNGITAADPDAGASDLLVTLTVTNGILTADGSGGAVVTNNGTPSVTIEGTVAEVNDALDPLVFAPNPGYTGPAVLTIVTDDQGNTGLGGAKNDTDTVNIQVLKFRRLADALGAGYCGLTGLEGFALIALLGLARRLKR